MRADETDPVRGRFLNNSEVAQVLFDYYPAPESFIPVPRNIIVMISDGCGYNQIAATGLLAVRRARDAGLRHLPASVADEHLVCLGKRLCAADGLERLQLRDELVHRLGLGGDGNVHRRQDL